MKKIEWFWNLIYYNVYRFDLNATHAFKYINPFWWLNKIPSINKKREKYGIDELAFSIFDSPKNGLSINIAGSFMGVLLVFIELGIFNLIQRILNKPLYSLVLKDILHITLYLVLFMVPVVLINNRLLFRKKKYLDYFYEFEKLTNKRKVIYGFLTFIVVIFAFSFFIGTFLVL
jgi:hypothetical protein